MATRLEAMAQKAIGTKGMPHHSQIRAIREYLRYTPESDLLREVEQIEDIAVFNILLEAGLNLTLQEAITLRWLQIVK